MNRARLIFLFFALSSPSWLSNVAPLYGQSQSLDPKSNATFTLDSTRRGDPVQLVDFLIPGQVGSGRGKNGEPIQTIGDMWLGKAVMELRNVSGKTISSVWINVRFPESDDGHSEIAEQVHVGAMPAYARFKHDGTPMTPPSEAEIAIGTGDLFSVPILQNFSLTRGLLTQRGLMNPRTVVCHIAIVYFSDGTTWNSGRFAKAGATPGTYEPISPEVFYQSSVKK